MTPEGSARDGEIVNAPVIITCQGRNFQQLAARFPYVPKQLPIARPADGTMWDR